VAVPPPPAPFDPLLEGWPAGKGLHRIHGAAYGANEYNPTARPAARFRPIAITGGFVPTLYAAEGRDGAISETVFHDVPIQGAERRVDLARLSQYVYNVLAPSRDLQLVKLHSDGLRRLRVTNFDIIETEAADYHDTIAWGLAAYEARVDGAHPDGIVWMSRQFNSERAVMLFGDRVDRGDLQLISRLPIPLFSEDGRELIYEAAERAGITVVSP
jgi:hypothetical protein